MQEVKILSVNTSQKKGTIKMPVPEILLDQNGIRNDAHAGPGNRQVSLLGIESVRKFEPTLGRSIGYGEFAENITTEGMELWNCHPLDRFICGEVILEVTQIGKECHGNTCNIFKEVGNCVMPKEGIFCRVVRPGTLNASPVTRHPSRILEYHPKTYAVRIITLSDRAYRGEYEDRSGPRTGELAAAYFKEKGQPFAFSCSLLPDDPDRLKAELEKAREERCDFVFTTGGTGIGPRDFTPEVIRPMLDKEIPGIMEQIRVKYGPEKPAALLSRSIAGVMGETLVYALPGSVKAVNEYFAEISKTLLHSVYMVHGLDIH